ncbi:hypothetical protein MRX96_005928 [Rhipicephalus microplus]
MADLSWQYHHSLRAIAGPLPDDTAFQLEVGSPPHGLPSQQAAPLYHITRVTDSRFPPIFDDPALPAVCVAHFRRACSELFIAMALGHLYRAPGRSIRGHIHWPACQQRSRSRPPCSQLTRGLNLSRPPSYFSTPDIVEAICELCSVDLSIP